MVHHNVTSVFGARGPRPCNFSGGKNMCRLEARKLLQINKNMGKYHVMLRRCDVEVPKIWWKDVVESL